MVSVEKYGRVTGARDVMTQKADIMSKPRKRQTRDDLLTRWQAKAGCMHTQEEAQRRWRDLLPLLTEKQRGMLGSAWGHHVDVRLGRDEIDWACKRLREEWEKEEAGVR